MDVQILRAIIQSHGEVKEADQPKNLDLSSPEEQKFPPMDRTLLAALTRSFSDLLSYKVSPEAYQRYSVRLQVIEVLREWLRPYKEMTCSRTFFQSERVLEFTARVARIYLTNELLYRDDGNIDVLVNLAKALIILAPKRKSFLCDLERILRRIGELKQTEASERLFINAAKEKDSLELSPRTIENLYVVQRVRLVESPIVENFIGDIKSSNGNFESSKSIETLLAACVDSPTVFHITCSVLKEIFVNCEHSPRVIDYIGRFLESLDSHCRKREKNLLDLYPLGSQALVILLRIVPEHHTTRSREHTLASLLKTHSSNPEETLILMTHFPRWLQSLTDRLAKQSRFLDDSMSFEKCDSFAPMVADDE